MTDDTRTTFVLVPGAGGEAWFWHLLEPELRALGHDTVAVDLPAGDERAGLDEYAAVVLAAFPPAGGRTVVVGQSMGGLTATLVASCAPVDMLVLLNAMVPRPGETPEEWWENTGFEAAREAEAARHGDDPGDIMAAFFHDVPDAVRVAAQERGDPEQTMTPFVLPWPLDAWPDVPTRFLQGRDDRFFPLAFQQAQVADRLGIAVDEMPGGHLVALSRPAELAARLDAYAAELTDPVRSARTPS
ncbi:MAG: alpha/beta hydrolase [Pseudonocardia sp.]|uniref:alpha/beta fold hydrolase n=1 Tax=unclassified Pseudonocardia TaxID=2619320 RepID=UPI000868BA3E|nr:MULTISPECIES: alpha/beta hydrolase [unclassified Pseudonocardia]MBN9108098.1 alpha/beta hydrolase [Pseudonocardia sp.]ODU20690.1 MAG: alpha/beta hydrolase [Pseudonocardia sp. SCN 72-51]ODV06165.1 MAG: alpha/beta hydrolase [Pseudonocardia sp. SCN 73-27]